ncbi:uncharacterized protein LOC134473242 isoform X2 [Cavia porcellus]|uniref:uncharacterized protein LOC134473242 isoform X2 n=1 Tax=Cavia porcellus TaxID=10141 RepID=UPI002FDFA229
MENFEPDTPSAVPPVSRQGVRVYLARSSECSRHSRQVAPEFRDSEGRLGRKWNSAVGPWTMDQDPRLQTLFASPGDNSPRNRNRAFRSERETS